MPELYLGYAVTGLLALGLALISKKMRELPLSEALLALLAGVLVGPFALGLIELSEHTRDIVLLEGSRVIVALSVMGAALRFPARRLGAVARPVVLLLVVAMPLAAAISGAATLLLALPLSLAGLVGACLCPTDPVLAGSVISGQQAERDLPERVRHTLSVESGINDGLALPLVGLAVAVVVPTTTPGAEAGRLLYGVVVGSLIGAGIGFLAGWATRRATADDDFEPAPNLVLTLLLAVATLGVGRYASTDGILAVFVAGMAYNALVSGEERVPQEHLDEAINRYLSMPLFFLLGVVAPLDDWAGLGPAALAFVLLVLGLRRLPVVLALAQPLGLPTRPAAFLGWFGPMGASSIFYLAHSVHEGVSDPRFFAVTSLLISASVLAFGVTGSPGRTLYARSPAPAQL